jgi:hypothetical protein
VKDISKSINLGVFVETFGFKRGRKMKITTIILEKKRKFTKTTTHSGLWQKQDVYLGHKVKSLILA